MTGAIFNSRWLLFGVLGLLLHIGSLIADQPPNILFIAIDDLRPELGYAAQASLS